MTNTSASGGYLTPVTPSIPLEDAALDAVFQALIVGITGITGTLVRPRWQPVVAKQPDPSVNWCAIGVKDQSLDANPSISHDPSANGGIGRSTSSRQETLTVLASFYGPNAKHYASQAKDALYIDQNRGQIELSGIKFVECGNIIAAPELTNEQWVRRYDVQMTFRRTIIRVYEVQNLLSAQVGINNEIEVSDISIVED